MGTQPVSGTTAYSAKQAVLPIWWMRRSPLWRRVVPSYMKGPVAAWLSQRCDLPVMQLLQRPHAGTNERMTCCPGRTDVTPGPTFSTVPAPSCPRTTGRAMGASPCMKWRSLRQMPAAPTFTRTSQALGSSSSRSSMTNGVLGSYNTAALTIGKRLLQRLRILVSRAWVSSRKGGGCVKWGVGKIASLTHLWGR